MPEFASAHLFYGLTVRACDLVAAGKAFELVGPALDGLELINLRLSRGRLITSVTGAAVGRVPGEVWKMVGEWVTLSGIRAARSTIQEEMYCEECDNDFVQSHEYLTTPSRVEMTLKVSLHQTLLDALSETVHQRRLVEQANHVSSQDWVDHRNWPECTCRTTDRTAEVDQYWITQLDHSQFAQRSPDFALGRVLAKFGLYLPLGSHTQSDMTRPSTIATALASAPDTKPEVAACQVNDAGGYLQAHPSYANVDTKEFEVPSQADVRLKRFMTAWAVSVAEVASTGGRVAVDQPRFMLACEVAD